MKLFVTLLSFSLAARQYDTATSGSGDSGKRLKPAGLRNYIFEWTMND